MVIPTKPEEVALWTPPTAPAAPVEEVIEEAAARGFAKTEKIMMFETEQKAATMAQRPSRFLEDSMMTIFFFVFVVVQRQS